MSYWRALIRRVTCPLMDRWTPFHYNVLFLYDSQWHHVGSIISLGSPPTHADIGCDLVSQDQALYLVDFAGSARISSSSSLCPSLPNSTSTNLTQ